MKKNKALIVIVLMSLFMGHSGFLIKSKEPTALDIYLNSLSAENKQDLSEKKYDHLSTMQREIFILLSRIETSPYEFIRNGVSYTGKKAGKHFRWKYSYGLGKIKTTEHFIDHVATKSMKSNKKYLIKLSESEVYPLSDILYNELRTLRKVENLS